MEPWLIAVIVIASLLGLYIFFFLTRLFRVLSFRKAMRQKLDGCLLCLREEAEIMLGLLQKEGFIEDKERLNEYASSFAEHHGDETWIKQAQETTSRSFGKIETQCQVKNKEAFEKMSDLLLNYQKIALRYNRDLLGYEYWRKNPLYRWIFNLLGFKKRQRLI